MSCQLDDPEKWQVARESNPTLGIWSPQLAQHATYGPRGRIRTCGCVVPNHAVWPLTYSRMVYLWYNCGMSRSRRKTPKTGIAGGSRSSDKWSKAKANRKFRRKTKAAVYHEREIMPELREVSDVWDFNKDGKFFFDPNKYPKYLRK